MMRRLPEHGTADMYNNHGCRCKRCRKAWREWCRDYRHRTGRAQPRAAYLADVAAKALNQPHGTESKYVNQGCRCDECTKAATDARYARRTRDLEQYRAANRRDYAKRRLREAVQATRSAEPS